MYSTTKRVALLVFLCLLCSFSFAQQQVNGIVKDTNGEPLIGVNVMLDGKAIAITDVEGKFSLNDVKSSSVVSLSYIGYQKQSMTIGKKTFLNFVLEEDTELLEEVVVVGYGTMKKNDLLGSVGSVSTEKLVMKGTPSLMEALQGSVAGVNITQNNSRTGGSFDIEIRGKSSLNSNTTPLYVVDGVICDDIQWLNQQDIERIDILKDAASTAIYGSRATAGVVMVTTKGALSQKDSKPSISYDGYYGVSNITRVPDFQNGDEFYTYRLRKFLLFAGQSGNSPQPVYVIDDYPKMALETTAGSGIFVMKKMLEENKTVDWPYVIARSGIQQNHFVNISGSSSNVKYHLGVGYNRVKGIYEGDDERKYNFKGSLDAEVNKHISTGFIVNMAKIDNDYASDNGVNGAYLMNPFMRPYNDEGEIIPQPGNRFYIGTQQNQFTETYNPLLHWENEEKARETYRLLGNFYINIKPLESLTLKSTLSPYFTTYKEGYFEGTLVGTDTNSARLSSSTGFSWTWDNVLTFEKTFNDIHHLNIMGLASSMAGHSQSDQINSKGVLEGTRWYNLKSGTINPDNTRNSYGESSMLSFAFRANYTLLDRYMFNATIRRDGSSKFAQGNRWGNFPSVAFAWRMSEEPWMEQAKSWLNNLKLRTAYGITGNNTGIGNYATQVTVAGPVYYPYGSNYESGFYPSGVVNKNLKWEKSNELNIALDFGLFGSRISGSVDWYDKLSSDLLFNVQLPLVASGSTMTTNIGSVRNTGVELTLTTVNVETRNWHFETSLTFAHNKNRVVDINGLGTDLPSTGKTGGLFIGYPTANVYTYKWDGIVSDKPMTVPDSPLAVENGFTPGDQVRECDYYFEIYEWNEGQPIIRDVNQDGVFDDEDKFVYSSAPQWTSSFNLSLSYKNWDFSASLYAKVGYIVSSPFYNTYYALGDRGRMHLNADWYVPAGTLLDCDGVNADGTLINPVYQEYTHYGSFPFPNTGAAHEGTGKNGDLWLGNTNTLVDASFLKVKNITLGYTLPKAWLNKINCSHWRWYLTLTNPFVLTSYKGFDPEWASTSLSGDGPSTITWQLGTNIKF
jgi:TonB-linked SusC/RagA family outer membrane protein